VSLASAVVMVATFLPWYSVLPPSPQAATSLGELTIFDMGFGGWRWAVPGLAALGLIAGVIDAAVRPAHRGAVTAFVVLRLLVVAELAVVVLAIAFRTPHGVGAASDLAATIRWPAWGALAAAVVGSGAAVAAASPNV